MWDIDKNLELFRELITCGHNLYSWTYDANGNIIFSNCPNEPLFNTIFTINGCKDYLYKYSKTNRMPIILNDPIGLMWIAAFEADEDTLLRIHIIGPAFITEISLENIQKSLIRFNFSGKISTESANQLKSIPIIALTSYLQHALMLHFCITGKKISTSDLQYQLKEEIHTKTNFSDAEPLEYHGSWLAEQSLMDMVRTGNLNYKAVLDNLRTTGSTGQMSVGDPLRHGKNAVIIFTASCARAAISGGLTPDVAYTLSDYYIQSIEDSKTLSDCANISHTMVDDFVHRVYKLRTSHNISKQILDCCDYIETHVKEKLSIKQMALKTGYTEYYFSKKFKKEIGSSVSEYINKVKIGEAKMLLQFTTQSIQDISDSLGFCSQSYFAGTFRKLVGIAPGEYRDANPQ